MKVNFFKAECSHSTSEIKFGLCDDDNTDPAYIDTANPDNWIATVLNAASKEIQFTAIDNCIDIHREDGNMDSRCDAMLQYECNLLFVELKTKRTNWKAEGLGQIEATIKRMIKDETDFYYSFRRRKAVVANARKTFPSFQVFDSEQREYFKRNYKIHLQFDAEMVIG